METNSLTKLVIIGSGPAGLTAGIYAARANLKPCIVEGKNPGGQLMGTSLVENWPGEKSIMGPKLMMNMREHAAELGCSFVSGPIIRVDFKKKPFVLTLHNEKKIDAQAVIVATGATPKRLGCPGEQEYWGKGVSTCAVCDGTLYKDKPVIIIGGGDTAMEDATFMTNFTDDIVIVHILDALTASAAMQEKVINNAKIKIVYSSTVTEIKGDGSHVISVVVSNKKTGEAQELKVSAAFIAIGLNPNTEIFRDQLELQKNGYLLVKNHTHTSVAGVFCAGDVADFRYRQAITSAGAGCMAALDAERYLKETHKHS